MTTRPRMKNGILCCIFGAVPALSPSQTTHLWYPVGGLGGGEGWCRYLKLRLVILSLLRGWLVGLFGEVGLEIKQH